MGTPPGTSLSPTFPRLPFLIFSLSFFVLFRLPNLSPRLGNSKEETQREKTDKRQRGIQLRGETKEEKKLQSEQDWTDIGWPNFYICLPAFASLLLPFRLFFYFCSLFLPLPCNTTYTPFSSCTSASALGTSSPNFCPILFVSRRTCPVLVLAGPYLAFLPLPCLFRFTIATPSFFTEGFLTLPLRTLPFPSSLPLFKQIFTFLLAFLFTPTAVDAEKKNRLLEK